MLRATAFFSKKFHDTFVFNLLITRECIFVFCSHSQVDNTRNDLKTDGVWQTQATCNNYFIILHNTALISPTHDKKN